MAQILVRNLDKKVVAGLKRRARQNGRSLQAEVKMILEQSMPPDPGTALARILEFRKQFEGRVFSDSVDLLREERER